MRTSIGIGIGVGLGSNRRAWTPKSLGASLALWLRSDLGVSIVGGRVASWSDQSGNGRDMAQGTFSKQPVIQSGHIGGMDSVYFDGVSKIVATTADFSSIAGSGDFFAVMRLAQDPTTLAKGYGGCWQFGGDTATEDYLPYYGDGTIYCGVLSASRKTTSVSMGSGYFASPRIFSVYSAASSWKMLTDGVERYSTASNSFGLSASSGIAIGGDPETSVVRMYGGIAEVIVASPSLTTAQRSKVYRYLGARYGISVP